MQLCYILLVLALLSDYVNAVGGRKKENRESFGLHDVDFDTEVVCGVISIGDDRWFEIFDGNMPLNNLDPRCVTMVKLTAGQWCEDLGTSKTGFFDQYKREMLCKLGCSGFSRMCNIMQGDAYDGNMYGVNSGKTVDYVHEALVAIFDSTLHEEEDTELFASVDEKYFWNTVKRTYPVLLTLIPLMLNQYEYFNFWPFIFSMAGLFASYIFIGFSTLQLVYNVSIWVICLLSDAGRSPVKEFGAGYLIIVVSLFVSFFVDFWMQVVGALSILIGYLLFAGHVFFNKGNKIRGFGVIMFIMNFMVMIEQITYLQESIFMDTMGLTASGLIANCVIPNGGSKFFYKNALAYSHRMIKYVPEHKMVWFFAFLVLQYILFLMFRCVFGAYVINALRFKTDLRSISLGGLLYSSDVFGGINYLVNSAFREERVSDRRVTYSLVNVMLLFLEYSYAFEFFVLRLFVWASDKTLWHSNYSHAPRFLQMDIDMRGQAFPQVGDSVWISLESLSKTAKAVRHLSVLIGDKWFAGVGFVVRVGNLRQVLTINHVGKCDVIQIDGQSYAEPDIYRHSGGEDPIVGISVPDYSGFCCDDIGLLTSDDAPNIKHVYIAALSKDKEVMLYGTGDFEIDRKGDLRVRSSLKEGDSGSPVFAALKDGELKYAGAVSRTSDVRGLGHVFSMITTTKNVRFDSDSEPTAPRKGPSGDFNKERGSLMSRMRAQQDIVLKHAAGVDAWISDTAAKEGAIWVEDIEEFQRNGGFTDESDDFKANYDKRRKRNNKTARKKRADLRRVLEVAYPGKSVLVSYLVKCACRGDIPELKGGALIWNSDGHNLIIDDNPDDDSNDWSGSEGD